MAPSFDGVFSSLLCGEEDNGIFHCTEVEERWLHSDYRTHNQNQSFNVLPLENDECVALMVEKETQYLPGCDYLEKLQSGVLDLGARNEAVDWIGKVIAHFGFGPLCEYLSVRYLDKFLSVYEASNGKEWMMQLLAVACVSIAAKVEETEVPLSLDLQVENVRFLFEAKTIQRMELLVLSTLKWRMQAVTPFSFIDYFLSKINNNQILDRTSIQRSIYLILSTVKGIDFLEFKPSEVAAAVAACVAGETQAVDTDKAISALIQHVEQDRVVKCISVMHDLWLINPGVRVESSVRNLPQSPIGVLEAACFSYKTNYTNSSHTSPGTKRMKLN